jgi:hypothetical protein
MTPTREQPIVVERLADEAAECHACGAVRTPINLVHVYNLCQHFVGLCDEHLALIAATTAAAIGCRLTVRDLDAPIWRGRP